MESANKVRTPENVQIVRESVVQSPIYFLSGTTSFIKIERTKRIFYIAITKKFQKVLQRQTHSMHWSNVIR